MPKKIKDVNNENDNINDDLSVEIVKTEKYKILPNTNDINTINLPQSFLDNSVLKNYIDKQFQVFNNYENIKVVYKKGKNILYRFEKSK